MVDVVAPAEVSEEIPKEVEKVKFETPPLLDIPPGVPTDNPLKRKEPPTENGDSDAIVAIKTPELVYYNLKTGIVYDVRMRYHSRIVTSPLDYVDPHPEDPRRIYRIYKAIAEAGLITDPLLQGVDDLGPLMQKIPIRKASMEEILEVHTKEHLDFVASTVTMSRDELIQVTETGDSIYVSNDSYDSALLSCGGTIEACRAVVEHRVKNAVAVVRPPGHHAEPHTPGGFCLFSNVAVAAKVLLRDYPESVRRILILDWDVHHGNGTQKAFLDDPRVLYMSLHRHENGAFYPGTHFGDNTVVGEGPGKGYNVNIAWSHGGMGDGDYLYAFEKVVMPIAMEYDPDLVIVSAGFDAAEGDIVGGCKVTPNGYGQMTHMLKSLGNGRLAVVLEGGYNLSAIASSALAATKVLLGDPPGMPRTKEPSVSAIRDVNDIINIHSAYWKSLRPGLNALGGHNGTTEDRGYPRLDQVIRSYQAHSLLDKFGMASLPLLKSPEVSSSALIQMENQILGTPNIHKQETIVVLIHDPPDLWAAKDPVSGALAMYDSVFVDPASRIINWATDRGYGVIDVFVPSDYPLEDLEYSASACAQETCLHLWDSYIDYFDAKNIIFMGIGTAYHGIVYLAGQREIRHRASAVVGFVGSPTRLKQIVPVIDEYTTEWFYRTSVIFTASDHAAWDTNVNPKRPRRKYGRVLKADAVGTDAVVEERLEEAVEFIDDMLEDDNNEDDDE
uniref:Histone deacetylase n=1 Tax=Blastobotrys adeninivorans TaxID=409370 RepID=A0A060T6R8_BLAAD